jgi:peptide/nickel transport system substrate-binding protein
LTFSAASSARRNAAPKKQAGLFPILLALLLISSASAETRPRYGGTLRVEMRAAPQSLDPAAATQDPGFAQIAPLLYDTLVRLDASGRPVPSLAASWQQESERRWRVTLRPGVHLADGNALGAAMVAQSLHESNPEWNVSATGDAVVIESDQPLPDLPAALALSRNAIVLRSDGRLLGTGPFRVADFQAGRRLTLAAQQDGDGWHERPFLDTVDIQFGRGAREQMLDLELGRADLVEAAPDQLARLIQSGRRASGSDPVELLALRFSHSNLRDVRVRQAITLAIDRESIFNVLLQRQGEPAAGLLPNWITGYSFLFPATPQVARARQLRTEARQTAALTLVYDAADPLARLVAERIALNVADAGITLKTLPSSQNLAVPDIELVRLRLASTDPGVALAELARTDRLALSALDSGSPPLSAPLGGPPLSAPSGGPPLSAPSGGPPLSAPSGGPPLSAPLGGPPLSAPGVGADRVGLSNVYRETLNALQDYWAVPIAYLPAAYALSSRVRNWTRTRDGSWDLENVWLAAENRP